MSVLVIGAPLLYRHRIYNTAVVIHRGRVLGVATKSYLPTYREFYELRQMAAGDDICDDICLGRGSARVRAPLGPDLLFSASDLPGFTLHVEICEDMWIRIAAQRSRQLGRRYRTDELIRKPCHHRSSRRPVSAGSIRVTALRCCVHLRGVRTR